MKRIFIVGFVMFFLLNGILSDETLAIESEKTLLFLPLDSRPVNTYVPEQVAKITGIKVLVPPQDLLGDLNVAGDTDQLIAWMEQYAKDADGFVFSADMLAYGGLVASRTDTESEEQAIQNLAFLEVLKKKYPNKPLYVYASLLRLAPSIAKQEDVTVYESLRKWAILMGDAKKNKTEITKLENEIDAPLLENYQAFRHRNVSVNQALVQYAKNNVLDVLIFGQDDAASEGIHQKEKRALEKEVKKEGLEHVFFLSGIDEVGSTLLTRFALENEALVPSVYVVYDHPFAPFWTSPFDAVSVAKNMQEHLLASGMKRVYHPFLADFYVYVNTPFENLYPLPKTRVAVADIAVVNHSEPRFVQYLLDEVAIDEIVSYSGWNTGGNAIGLSLSFAGARLVSLQHGKAQTTLHHAELLYRSFLLDNGYKTTVYPTLKSRTETYQHDPYNLGVHLGTYEKLLNKALQKENDNLFDYFQNKKLHTNQEKTASVTLGSVTLPPASFPWERLFEIDVSPKIKRKEKTED